MFATLYILLNKLQYLNETVSTMKITNLSLFLWAFILFLSIPTSAVAQSEEELKATAEKAYKNIISFAPASKKFLTIHLQTHNGLLRFGEPDNYFTLPDGSYVNHKSQAVYQEADKKSWQVGMGQRAYYELLRFKYMSDIYKDIDKELFTKYSSSMYKEDKNSWMAQTNLLKLANAVTHVTEMPRFFCNPKEKCHYDVTGEKYYHRNVGDVMPWGGRGASEFKQLGAYTAYVNENLSALQQWKNDFFQNDTEEGYLVVKAYIRNYDFSNKGYWLSPRTNLVTGKIFKRMELQPQNSNERKFVSPRGINILYEMSPEKAEKFSEEVKQLYMVFKIEITIKGMEANYEYVDAYYAFKSPIIALYTDDSLTKKVGEISMETMTTK